MPSPISGKETWKVYCLPNRRIAINIKPLTLDDFVSHEIATIGDGASKANGTDNRSVVCSLRRLAVMH